MYLKLAKFVLGLCLSSSLMVVHAQTPVMTYHNDIGRTGLNASETLLKPANVRPQTFGLLFNLPTDGQVYAQPLYLPFLNIPGKGIHNVVFIATQHNSVYAYDADSNLGSNAQPLWHVNFGSSIPNWEVGSDDINPEIGITSTPVIGPATYSSNNQLLYVVSKTKSFDTSGQAVYTQQIHALDVTTGTEKLGGPVTIQGSVPGTGEASVNGTVNFNSLIQHCRAALLLVPQARFSTAPPSKSNPRIPIGGGTLYVTFASHGDQGPYHGWVFAYDSANLKQIGILNTTPNGRTDPSGYPIAAGGIWQGGAGPASDGTNIYFSTGNGVFDPTTGSYGDAIVRMANRVFSFSDYFAPSNQLNLDDYDADLGSGGVMLLPRSAGSSATPNLLVHSGKEGTIYLLNQANLGHYGANDQTVQELPYVMGGVWGAPAYFNNHVYYGPSYSPLVSFQIKNGLFAPTTPVGSSTAGFQFPGPTPSLSSSGLLNGIVWAIQTDGYNSGGPAVLHAYDASNLGVELYSSANSQGRDTLDGAVKFAVPTITNGKVYVGTRDAVGVFGLGQWTATPTVTPAAGTYTSPIQVTLKCATPKALIYYTLDGSTPTPASTLYKGTFTLSTSATLQARAYAKTMAPSGIVSVNYLVSPFIGNGTGLFGSYFDGLRDPSGTPTISEIDPLINFNWNGGSPAAGVGGNNWCAEWKGQIQAMTTGTYTIYSKSDDGVQVSVNGQLLIDNYTDHAPTIDQGNIQLQSGQKVSIDIKFYQNQGGSLMQLYWSAPGLPQQLVPTSQLYPSGN